MAIMCGNIVEDTVYAFIYMDGSWLARLDLYLLMFEAFCTPEWIKDLHLTCVFFFFFPKAVCLLFDTNSHVSFFLFLASQWVDFRHSPRRTSGLTSPDTMRLRDASTRAWTASLRHLRYCPLQTRMLEHGTIWGCKISSFGFSHKLVIVSMNEGDRILMERHEFLFTQLLVRPSIMFFQVSAFSLSSYAE